MHTVAIITEAKTVPDGMHSQTKLATFSYLFIHLKFKQTFS